MNQSDQEGGFLCYIIWLFDVSGGNPQSNPALRDYPSQHFGLLPAPVCSPKPRFKMFIAAFLSLDILSPQCGHSCILTDRSFGTRVPQDEQICDV